MANSTPLESKPSHISEESKEKVQFAKGLFVARNTITDHFTTLVSSYEIVLSKIKFIFHNICWIVKLHIKKVAEFFKEAFGQQNKWQVQR